MFSPIPRIAITPAPTRPGLLTVAAIILVAALFGAAFPLRDELRIALAAWQAGL